MTDLINYIERTTPYRCKTIARNLIICYNDQELLTLRRTNDLITIHKLRDIPNKRYHLQYLIFNLRAGAYNVEA